MKIHTVKSGESIDSIAEEYGIGRELLEKTNGISPRTQLTAGEELAVILPTRTYKVRRGDTPERIALRFGVRKNELFAQNPDISGRELSDGELLILRTDEPSHGIAASNGTYYRGCGIPRLKKMLPYTTYVSVAEASVGDGKIKSLFDGSGAVKTINDSARVPLMRIFDGGTGEKYKTKQTRAEFIDELINAASARGYKGITLATGECARGSDENFAEFLVELRRKMIGCDLILICEMDENTPIYLNELSDGTIFSYDKCAYDSPPDFSDGERSELGKFATSAESSKSFLDISPFAFSDGKYETIDEAIGEARRTRAEIVTDEKSLLSSYERRGHTTRWSSLKNIKARLELLPELGFMGMSFDIMRTPIAHLMMYNSLYKTVSYTGLTSREGCNREL